MNKGPDFFKITTLTELAVATVAVVLLAVAAFFYCVVGYIILRIPVRWAGELGEYLTGDNTTSFPEVIATFLAVIFFFIFTIAWLSWLFPAAEEATADKSEATVAE